MILSFHCVVCFELSHVDESGAGGQNNPAIDSRQGQSEPVGDTIGYQDGTRQATLRHSSVTTYYQLRYLTFLEVIVGRVFKIFTRSGTCSRGSQHAQKATAGDRPPLAMAASASWMRCRRPCHGLLRRSLTAPVSPEPLHADID